MSVPFDFGSPNTGASQGYAPAAPPPRNVRHPLGLPAGSVRALLTIMVFGTFCTLLLMPPERRVDVPLYLYYLTFLILGSYFGARGSAPSDKRDLPPLYLPRGSIRILIILAFTGVIGYGIYQDPDFLDKLKLNDMNKEPWLPVVIFGSFFLGVIVAMFARLALESEEGMPAWYQDVLAWLSVLAVLSLGGGVVYELVIKPTLDPDAFKLSDTLKFPWQAILSGIVAFYFGARS